MEQTQWQRQDVTQHYLEQVRGGIPFGAKQINVIEWLRELGYRHADCYFKWFELAVFGGVK